VGSRTADKLKEIEEVRGSLAAKLNEIERRVPLAGFGKKIAMVVGGSSAASGVLAFAFRRFRGGRKAKKKAAKRGKGEQQAIMQPTSVTVNASVLPKGAAYLAAAGFAAWAGLKVYDAIKKGRNGEPSSGFKPAVVTPMPETTRQSGT
jgi:hypothetical protein